ncbi:MAG: O-acetylhomoserine aminocarboxypropyltransferase, partial [Sphingomonadales bacterium]
MTDSQKFSTLAVHAGAAPDPTTGARATPIYQTTSFQFQDVDHAARLFNLEEFGNVYSRLTNPTVAVLEARVAALEGGVAALGVGSGHAAQLIAMHTLLEPGDEFLASTKLYGGSITQFGHSFKKMGWTVHFVDPDDPDNFQKAMTPRVKAIFIESLANPGGVVTDIGAIAEIAHGAGVPLIVDNTLATPYHCRPIEHGADIVVHSLTKFLGGHGNSVGGIIVDAGRFDWAASSKFPSLSEPCGAYHGMTFTDTFKEIAYIIACRAVGLRDLGPALSPMNAFLLLTGIETLPLRMQKHSENTLAVARHLETHDKVTWVSYPGLPGDRYHQLANKYLENGYGAVFTFGLKGGYDAGIKLVNGVRLHSHLANVGDTRSLIIHPASTTHRQLPEAQQAAAGAGPDVVR